MFNTIGFIGTGTMGSAVARAAVKGAPEASILLSNRTPAKAEALAKDLGVQASDNETVARTCSLIFLGVKPQMMAGMLWPPGATASCWPPWPPVWTPGASRQWPGASTR